MTNLADTPSTIITLVADGNLYQVTPNSTINIHKYRASIMLDQNGISSIVKIMNPSSVIEPNELDKPILAVCGDSTFYHAVIPALINAQHNRADITFILLDNSGTAMTGFQPPPSVDALPEK